MGSVPLDEMIELHMKKEVKVVNETMSFVINKCGYSKREDSFLKYSGTPLKEDSFWKTALGVSEVVAPGYD